MTDLVRLVVQKMDIRTEMEGDDATRGGKNENLIRMQRFRQTMNVTRRFARLRPTNTGSMSHLYDHPEKAQ